MIGFACALMLIPASVGPGAEGLAPNIAWSPRYADDPRGEAPCVEGESRSATTYAEDYEKAIPWSRFNQGWYRTSSVEATGRYSAGSKLSGKSGSDEHHFLPYRKVAEGQSTYLQFAYRGNRAGVRGVVAINSVRRTFTADKAWRGQVIDVTPATRDEGGWLGGYVEHLALKGKTTRLYVDNVQLFTCRENRADRVGGPDGYATAAKLTAGAGTGGTVYVASGEAFAQSLPAGTLAGKDGAPLLLTRAATLPAVTRDALKALRPATVVIVGGTGSVSAPVASELAALAPQVERIAGGNAGEVAAAASERYGVNPARVYLVRDGDYSEAVAIGALAAKEKAPVLVTAGGSLSPAAATALQRLRPSRVVAVGSTGAISDAVLTAAGAFATGATPTERLTATDLPALSALVAGRYGSGTTRSYLSVTDRWPEGLAAAASAGAAGAPLLLTPKTGLAAPVQARLTALGESAGTLIGDASVASSILRDQYGRTLP